MNVNFPQNDPACATARCTYQVWVHYFKDARTPTTRPACGTALAGATCKEGDVCNCQGTVVPDGLCVTKECRVPPKASIKIYLLSQRTPALEIPVPVTDTVSMLGPCFMWHAADIEWPSKLELQQPNPPPPVAREVKNGSNRVHAFYGKLDSGFSCTPNTTVGTKPWFILNSSGPPTYP